MRITLIFTGKTQELYLKEGIDEYIKRIKRYVPLELVVIPGIKNTRKTDLAKIKTLEGEQILNRLKSGAYLILLDEKGKSLSSVEFAKTLTKLESRTGHLVFVIGGAYGFSEEVYARTNELISLSKMTFSHQMVRLIFTEQLYRAYTILNGEPYHHI